MASSNPSFWLLIENVVDVFVPFITMVVHYGSKLITNCCTITPSIACLPPRITISGHPRDLYTLVMTDPDSPNPSNPSMREVVHWMITDIPGGTSPAQGKDILPYLSPVPSIGIHRYILVLYKQKRPLGSVNPPQTRVKFCSRAFALQFELAPAAVMFFNAGKEPKKRTRVA